MKYRMSQWTTWGWAGYLAGCVCLGWLAAEFTLWLSR